MDELQIIEDHTERAQRAREFLAHEYKDLINSLKSHIDLEPTAGMLAVLVNALKGFGDLYQVKQPPGQQGRLTELAVSRLIAAAVEQERQRVLEEVKASRQELLGRAAVSVQESLKALSDKSLG